MSRRVVITSICGIVAIVLLNSQLHGSRGKHRSERFPVPQEAQWSTKNLFATRQSHTDTRLRYAELKQGILETGLDEVNSKLRELKSYLAYATNLSKLKVNTRRRDDAFVERRIRKR